MADSKFMLACREFEKSNPGVKRVRWTKGTFLATVPATLASAAPAISQGSMNLLKELPLTLPEVHESARLDVIFVTGKTSERVSPDVGGVDCE